MKFQAEPDEHCYSTFGTLGEQRPHGQHQAIGGGRARARRRASGRERQDPQLDGQEKVAETGLARVPKLQYSSDLARNFTKFQLNCSAVK